MIQEKEGRSRSIRTVEEDIEALKKELATLTPDEQAVFEQLIIELQNEKGKAELYKYLSDAEFKTPPVDMETFIKDPYFLGNTCDNLWPRLMDDLVDLFEGGYHEVVYTGSIGWGKTFTASIGIARILYELSCLKDPHKTYGLAKGSNISIVCLSVNEQLATKVVFENISIKIKASPYFQENFPFEATKKELRFPNNIWVAARATTDTSALGLNTISALVDETNFMPTKGKQLDRVGYVDHAEVIYNSIKRRMKSRFEKHGKLPGMLFIVSSKKTMDDFTARRVRESSNDASVFVRDYALWDVKPEDHYSSKKFWVVVGNDQTPSRIIKDQAEAVAIKPTLPEGVVLIDVPEDFMPDFERDLEGSIRDLAGCATVSISPFIQRREKILGANDEKRSHPFSVNVYDPSKAGTFMWDYMVSQQRERDGYGNSIIRSKPIVNPNAPRHVHIDPSLRGDATGIAMAHIAGWKDVRRRSDDGREYMERAPVYYVDFVLRIVPPIGDEIIMGDVRRLVYDLAEHGYMITCVSMDSWQSADAMQQLKQRGYNSVMVSVDTTMDPYENMKTALYEERISLYHYEPLVKELQQLEKDTKKRKIDHPPKGSKDVSDALAGCLYTLSQQQTAQPLPILRGTAYYGEAWMAEQQQASMAGSQSASRNTDLRDVYSSSDMPLPFMTGTGRTSGGGSGGGGFGDF